MHSTHLIAKLYFTIFDTFVLQCQRTSEIAMVHLPVFLLLEAKKFYRRKVPHKEIPSYAGIRSKDSPNAIHPER